MIMFGDILQEMFVCLSFSYLMFIEINLNDTSVVSIPTHQDCACVGCGAGCSSGHCIDSDDGSSSCGGCGVCGTCAARSHHFPYLIRTEGSRVNDVTQREGKTHKHNRLIQPVNKLWVCDRRCNFHSVDRLWLLSGQPHQKATVDVFIYPVPQQTKSRLVTRP